MAIVSNFYWFHALTNYKIITVGLRTVTSCTNNEGLLRCAYTVDDNKAHSPTLKGNNFFPKITKRFKNCPLPY